MKKLFTLIICFLPVATMKKLIKCNYEKTKNFNDAQKKTVSVNS